MLKTKSKSNEMRELGQVDKDNDNDKDNDDEYYEDEKIFKIKPCPQLYNKLCYKTMDAPSQQSGTFHPHTYTQTHTHIHLHTHREIKNQENKNKTNRKLKKKTNKKYKTCFVFLIYVQELL